MAVDLMFDNLMYRIVSVYLPHAGYVWNDFQSSFEIISNLLAEAVPKHFRIMIGGDFNLSYGVGRRGEVLQELCDEYWLTVLNGDGDAHQEDR